MNTPTDPRWLHAVSAVASITALLVSLTTACEKQTERAPDDGIPAREQKTQAEVTPKATETPRAEAASAESKPTATASKEETEKASAPADPPTTASVEVKRLVVTGGVDDREPMPTDALAAGQPIFAFVELANSGDDTGGIVITFEREEQKVGHVELDVPADTPRWRTWGKTSLIRKPGMWTAVVRDKGGAELARQSFEVSEA